ncbi:MAG: serine hydrolase domain-containing protein [Saprospiraceae bacterium]|nr:serine hydrolase domain-containing protein [Saprospiraceae bacterium]
MKYFFLPGLFFLFSFQLNAQAGIPSERWELMRRFLASRPDFSGVVLVAAGGETQVLESAGYSDRARAVPVGPQTLFDIGSVSKSFTATAILQLVEAGKLQLDAPLSRFFANVSEDKKNITVHQLLSHSAGLPDVIGFDYEAVTKEEFLHKTFASSLAFAPGKGYLYSNVGYSLLGMIVEQLSGEPYDAYLQKQVFAPAGMKTAGYRNAAADAEQVAHGYLKNGEDWGRPTDKKWDGASPYWHLKANGGLLMSAADMLQWYRALRGHTVLKKASLDLQCSPHVDEGGGQSFYGYGLVVTDEGQCIQHNGGNGIFRADFKWFPGLDVVFFLATNDARVPLFQVSEQLKQILLSGELPQSTEWQAISLEKFPADGRQKAADALLACLRVYTPETAGVFIDRHCSEGIVARNGKERLLEIMQMFAKDAGAENVKEVAVSGDKILLQIPARQEGVLLKITLTFDADKIDRIGAELTD